MPYRILLRRDNSAKWIQNDPVLMLGEPGYETDSGKLKIGDGQTPWSSLHYYGGGESVNIEVTYDELLNLKNTSSLIKGQNYLLTDYETTYTQPVTNVNKSSGVIEPLINNHCNRCK